MCDIERRIQEKITKQGIPLGEWNISINYGVKTGFNDAFIIDTACRDRLVAEDPKSDEIIRPILRGRDIRRYGFSYADLWLISTFPSRNYDIDSYPAVKSHLLSYGIKRLEQSGKKYIENGIEIKARKKTSNKWFETQDSISYWDDFSKQKIVFAETMRVHRGAESERFPRFSLINDEYYLDKTCFMIIGDELPYILAVINSLVMNYYIHKNVAVLDTGGFLMQKIYIEALPIPDTNAETKGKISALVEKLIVEEDYKLKEQIEKEIDHYIVALFGLTQNETDYILRSCHDSSNNSR